jgi:hypothetical protein
MHDRTSGEGRGAGEQKMFMIFKKRCRHWAAAIDEGYGPKPHIDLAISIRKKCIRYNLAISKNDDLEARALALMFRQLADDIEDRAMRITARLATNTNARD